MNIRNRVKTLRMVPASDLRPNPKNWRTHPKAQADALRGVLAEVGLADACLARELPDGSLMLIDGHLRAETLGDGDVPVLILDVNEVEADKILATLDPLAAMADSDAAKLDELLRNVDTGSEALQQMMAATAAQAGLYQSLGSDESQQTEEQNEENPYTDKVDAPQYHPRGPKPDVSELYSDATARKLIAAIEKSGVPDDEKAFLVAAAMRHVIFNFEKVADYYANSEAESQRLLEDSAMVIVDFDKAIQDGYARLSSSLASTYSEEKDAVDAE
jgi:hypothetical protein